MEAKIGTSVWDQSTTAASNTSIGGVNQSEGCAPSTLNNATRALAAQMKGALIGVTASGTDTYTATLAPAPDALTDGMTVHIRFTNANATTTPTLQIGSLTAKTIVKDGSAALVAGDIPAGHEGDLRYNGTNWVLLNPKEAVTGVGSGIALSSRSASLDINGLTADSSPDITADYVPTYDASGAANKKVLLNLLGQTYAEGSWTPTVAGGSTAGTQTYSTQVGRYIRHGNLVSCWFSLVMTAKDGTTAGAFTIAGLPFAASSVSGLKFAGAVGQFGNIDFTTGYSGVGLSLTAGSQAITVLQGGDNAAASGLTASAISATTEIHGSIAYRIN